MLNERRCYVWFVCLCCFSFERTKKYWLRKNKIKTIVNEDVSHVPLMMSDGVKQNLICIFFLYQHILDECPPKENSHIDGAGSHGHPKIVAGRRIITNGVWYCIMNLIQSGRFNRPFDEAFNSSRKNNKEIPINIKKHFLKNENK